MKEGIYKTFNDSLKSTDLHYQNIYTNLNDINVALIFKGFFPDTQYPSEVFLPIKMGLPIKLIKDLKETFNFVSVWSSYDLDYSIQKTPLKNVEILANDTFMIKVTYREAYSNSSSAACQEFLAKQKNENPETVKNIKLDSKNLEVVTFISGVSIYFKNDLDFKKHNDFFIFLNSYHKLEDVHESFNKNRSNVSLLIKEADDYYFKNFSISNKASLDNADLIYGDKFTDFNRSLIERVNNEKKGLVLLHGKPGTGKTYYIRYLLKELSNSKKRILYIPPSLVEYMMEPQMLNFIIEDVSNNELDTILLIEDAEPLVESRDNNLRTGGITNLLNSTDGILNDVLGLIVIATFNTKISRIDSALLRPGRLLGRKEFKEIPSKNIPELCEKLNIDQSKLNKSDYTIAELTSLSDNNKIIDHEVIQEKKIGFGSR